VGFLLNEGEEGEISMRKVVVLSVAAVISAASSAYGQGSDLQQKLKDQFSITKVTTDGSDITSAGTVVTLRKAGLWAYSTASPVPYLNTYNEKGKISQPFMANLGAGVAGGLRSNNTQFPHRLFMGGERFSIIGLFFQNDGFTLRLYSDPYDGIRYYGDLKFPFKKGSPPPPDEALARIAEVLVVPPVESTNNAQQKAPAPQGAQPLLTLGSVYVNSQNNADRLQLNSDGSFSLQEGGQSFSGTYSVAGATLKLHIVQLEKDVDISIQGARLTVNGNENWIQPNQ
jgi:hypothetical protein